MNFIRVMKFKMMAVALEMNFIQVQKSDSIPSNELHSHPEQKSTLITNQKS
ncbi:hypothetical protein ACQKMN_04445 [Ureibacillus composti]